MVKSLTGLCCFLSQEDGRSTPACTTLISSLRTKKHVFLSVYKVLTLCACVLMGHTVGVRLPHWMTRLTALEKQEDIITQIGSNNDNQYMFVPSAHCLWGISMTVKEKHLKRFRGPKFAWGVGCNEASTFLGRIWPPVEWDWRRQQRAGRLLNPKGILVFCK